MSAAPVGAISRAGSVRRREGLAGRLPALLIGLGAVLRIAQYLFNRSLWLDEAMLASNIQRHSFTELLQPLDRSQVAPIGFLMLEKLVTRLLGEGEYALRLVPLAAGLASLLLFFRVASRCLSKRAASVALGFFSLCGPLIFYSSELKPYSSDVAIALLLLGLALRAREETPGWRRPLAALAITGALAVWFSHPAALVLAGIGLTLGVSAMRRRDAPRLRLLAAAGALWLASFGAAYALGVRDTAATAYLLKVWSPAFMPFPPTSFSDLLWFPRSLRSLFAGPAGLEFAGLGILAFLVGSAASFAADPQRLSLLLTPILLTMLASGLHKYPFAGRLLLFLVPSVLLLVAEGADRVREATRRTAPVAGIGMLVLLFLHPVLAAAQGLVRPRTREEIRPVLAYVRAHRLPGDRLYLYHGALDAFGYYSVRYGFTARDAIAGVKTRDWNGYRADLKRLDVGRIWVVFSHVREIDGTDEETLLLHLLDDIGTRRSATVAPGAAAYLYDLGTPLKPSAPPPDGGARP